MQVRTTEQSLQSLEFKTAQRDLEKAWDCVENELQLALSAQSQSERTMLEYLNLREMQPRVLFARSAIMRLLGELVAISAEKCSQDQVIPQQLSGDEDGWSLWEKIYTSKQTLTTGQCQFLRRLLSQAEGCQFLQASGLLSLPSKKRKREARCIPPPHYVETPLRTILFVW